MQCVGVCVYVYAYVCGWVGVVVVSLDFYNIYVQVRVMLFDDPFIVFVNLCTCYTRPCFTYCRHYGDREAILYANFLTQFSALWLTAAILSLGVEVRDLFIFSLFENKLGYIDVTLYYNRLQRRTCAQCSLY